jgi:hypothetical protein
MPDNSERPVYRHIVVQRKALVEHVDVEQLRRLRRQMDANQVIDEDLRHLVVKDTLKQSVKKAMAWAGHGNREVSAVEDGLGADSLFAEADSQKMRGDEDAELQYQRQEGVIVSRIVMDHMPGDAEGTPMPQEPTYLFHPGFDSQAGAQDQYMRCAQELHAQFVKFSDRKFLLMEPALRAGLTLVTLVLTPIIAVPRVDIGVELLCEFHQKTQFGYVDTTQFEVFSEIGEYPIQVPSDGDMNMMFTTKDDFLAWEAEARKQG